MHLPFLIGPHGLVSGAPSVSTSLAKTDGLTSYPTYRVLSGNGYELDDRGESNSLDCWTESRPPNGYELDDRGESNSLGCWTDSRPR